FRLPPRSSYSVYVLLAEKPFGPDEQESEREHVGEPVLDAAADQRPEIDLRQLLAGADDEPADDRAGHRRETAEDQHRQRLQRPQRRGDPPAQPRPPPHAGDRRADPPPRPHDEPDLVERYAYRLRGLVVVRPRAHRAADARLMEEDREPRHQPPCRNGGEQV